MATIYNSELTKELITSAKLQVSKDIIPNQLAEKVVPVMEVNPKLLRRTTVVKNGSAINATQATIYTTPADQDFYITGIWLGMVKDGTATSTYSFVSCTLNGAANQNLIIIPGITLIAQYDSGFISFDKPLKVDRNTNILIGNSTNVGNVTARGIVFGYLDEQSNA